MNVIGIAPDPVTMLIDLENTAEAMQREVGGYFECIWPDTDMYGPWCGFVDEDGAGRLEPNYLATLIATLAGWPGGRLEHQLLFGPVVFAGETPDGDTADIPEMLLRLIRGLTNIVGSPR
jgi:hypothetical protein